MASSSTSNDAYGEKKLGLGHKIFLSYSGADQDFLWELYDDLREHCYDPFFDQKSLPKAAPVSMKNIVQEAADSKLAVFCLSEDFFTRNRNPLMELVVCVKNGMRLLPLFYKISVDMIKKSMESWYKDEWSKWEDIDRDKFKEALKKLLGISGIENKEGCIPTEFRRKVIEEIQKIIPPDIRPDVSDICGRDRLVKVVRCMFDKHLSLDESTQAPAVVLGLYGSSGTGKSTLCRMLAHDECPAACYIQLDSIMDEKAQLERMKKVLSSVTNLSTDFINKLTKPKEAQKQLFEQEYVKKVFLFIDNVILRESLEEARIYLDGGCRRYKPGSKILITAHTKDVLDGLKCMGGKWHIDAMPDLEEEEAKQILLKRSGSIHVKMELVKRCLNLCRFGKGGQKGVHYHPLMLNALAESLANRSLYSKQEEMTKWVDSLESSFSPTDSHAKERVLQHLLKSTSYDLLNDLQKQVFLDMAFYLPRVLKGKGEILEWLKLVHGKNIEEAVLILERRGLIDLSELLSRRGMRNRHLMHDLYHEMATLIVQEKGSECLVFQGDGLDKQFPLNCKNITRILCHRYHFRCGADLLQKFPSLRVLATIGCKGMENLDLRRAICLCSLEYSWCRYRLDGTKPEPGRFYSPKIDLSDLKYLSLDLHSLDCNPPIDFRSCTNLENLIISNSVEHPNLRDLTNLRVFRYTNCESGYTNYGSDGDLVVFQFGPKIESIFIEKCKHVSGLKGLNHKCISLRKLELNRCELLKCVEGLGELKSLETLSLIELGLTAFPRGLLKFPKPIQNLRIKKCNSIPARDIVDILSTPDLPSNVYLTAIWILRGLTTHFYFPRKWNNGLWFGLDTPRWLCTLTIADGKRWQSAASLVVESEAALHTISILLQDDSHHHHVRLLELVLYLCLGGRHMKLKELVSKAHVVKALSEAQKPFCLLLLAFANQQFGVDLEAHASTIATMVTKAYLEREKEWPLYRRSGAILVANNPCVAKELRPEVLDRVQSDMVNSGYNLPLELQLLEEH